MNAETIDSGLGSVMAAQLFGLAELQTILRWVITP
jgi:hypothetical protein